MKKGLDFILLNGAIGSGKSTIANLLMKKLHRTAILEIEDVRRLVTGNEDNTLAWKIIYRMCDEYLRNGINVLLKQSVASEDIVNTFVRLAKKYKCNICFYHFQAPKDVLLQRIKNRKKDRIAPKSLIKNNIEKHEKIHYASARVVDTSKMKPREVVRLVLNGLA